MLLLKLALRPWKIAPYSQLFSAVAVGFLLLLAGLLFWMQEGLRPVLSHMKQEQVITAYIDSGANIPDRKIIDDIEVSLGAHAGEASIYSRRAEPAWSIKLTTAQQFVEQVKSAYPDLGNDLEELGAELPTVVPRYISISGMLPEEATDKIRGVAGIESVESSRDRNRSALGAFAALRWAARLLTLGLCFALFTGLIHLARTNLVIHRDSLGLLRLLGAGAATLRFPAMLSGLFVGMTGGTIAFVGWMTGGLWFTSQVARLSPWLKDMPAASPLLGLALLAFGAMIGLLAGVFGCLAQKEI